MHMQEYASLPPPYRVYVVDDHKLVTDLLAQRLSTDPAIAVVGSGYSGAAACQFVAQHTVDVLLLDMELGEEDGVGVARELLAIEPGLRIVGLSAFAAGHYPLSLLEAGGRGFLSKRISTRDLVENVRRVARGDLAIGADVAYHLATNVRDKGPVNKLRDLTPREIAVLGLLARGYSTDEIATELDVAPKTVQTHCSNMRRKLALRSDVELCLMALKAGLVRVHQAK